MRHDKNAANVNMQAKVILEIIFLILYQYYYQYYDKLTEVSLEPLVFVIIKNKNYWKHAWY